MFLLTESENGLCFLFEISSIYFDGLIGTTLDELEGEADTTMLSLTVTCLRKLEQLYLSVSCYCLNCLAS